MSKHSSRPDEGRRLSFRKSVTRIAEQLAGAAAARPSPQAEEIVNRAIRARRLRYEYFPGTLLGEPAWDMLLELLHAQTQGRSVTVTDLCEAAGTPGSSTLRWLNVMAGSGLVRRIPDPSSPMVELVELEASTTTALWRYFIELSNER